MTPPEKVEETTAETPDPPDEVVTATTKTEPPGVLIYDLGDGLELRRVPAAGTLRDQPINAQIMGDTDFKALTRNIARAGHLESVPFCAWTDDVLQIVSGHHRVKAAAAGGLDSIIVLVNTTGLTRSEIVAKQIAHNQIVGSPDETIVAQLLTELITVDDLLETGLPQDQLPTLVDPGGLPAFEGLDPDIHWRTMTLTMLSDQFDDVDAWVSEHTGQDPDTVAVLAPVEQFDRFQAALGKWAERRRVRSAGIAVGLLTETAADENLADEILNSLLDQADRPTWAKEDVPWAALFGCHRIAHEQATALNEWLQNQADDDQTPLETLLGLAAR